MSFLKKIQESLRDPAKPRRSMNVQAIQPATAQKKEIAHEFLDFTKSYRIGILGYYAEEQDIQHELQEYKKKLEKLGYECEVLLFINKREKTPNVHLPYFNLTELDKELMPNSPRTDRFMVRRFDMLFNLFFVPCEQLIYLSNHSNARCRVSPYLDFLTATSDILIPIKRNNNISELINNINETLKLQPYVRDEI